MSIPTPSELARIIDAADPAFQAFIHVGAFAGLRRGEVAGLQLGDLDSTRGTLTVRRQVQGRTIADMDIRPPKALSERTIYLPKPLIDLLNGHVDSFGTLGSEKWLFHRCGHPYLARNVTTQPGSTIVIS